MQLEYAYLGHHLRDNSYAEKVLFTGSHACRFVSTLSILCLITSGLQALKVMQVLRQSAPVPGMYPVYVSPQSGKFTSGAL